MTLAPNYTVIDSNDNIGTVVRLSEISAWVQFHDTQHRAEVALTGLRPYLDQVEVAQFEGTT